MAATGVKRLIAVSAHGVLETHDQSLYSLAVWAGVADRMRDNAKAAGDAAARAG